MNVTEIMDVPAGRDEPGTPDASIEACTCGVLFRVGEAHRCGHVGEWADWERYQDRQEDSR